MKSKSLTFVIVIFTLAFAACTPKATPAANPAATIALTKKVPTATETATEMPTSIPTMTATVKAAITGTVTSGADDNMVEDQNPDSIVVKDQSVYGDTVVISSVTSVKPGWVAIFADDNGKPGTLIGYIGMPIGTSMDLKVPVDPNKLTDSMIAMLMINVGKEGKFEYPGVDVPAMGKDGVVMGVFNRKMQ